MGFLERSRSLRRKEPPFARRKQEETPAVQPVKDIVIDNGAQRPIHSAHSHKEPTWKKSQASKELPRPRTAGRPPAREAYPELPPPPSLEDLTDKHAFMFPNASPRMSMTPSPRTTTPRMTFHGNHSTTGVVALESPRNPKRSFTTPLEVPQVPTKKGAEGTDKPEATSIPPRKEPHLRKAKSGTWRSFFSRKQSKPPLPDFNPADVAPPPALPKEFVSGKSSSKSATKDKIAPVEQKPALPIKDNVRAPERNSISVDKMRGAQTHRAQMTKSMGDPTVLPKLKLENLSALDVPVRNFSRSPSAESGMTQFFDATSTATSPVHTPGQPRLDINIPAVEMERYSVMFEKLLKPQSALYERRQTMVKQLQLRAEPTGRLAPESPYLQRRATSPNLSCHTPLTAEIVDSSQLATPVPIYRAGGAPRLLRSQTAPPGALTPSRADFERSEAAPSTANNSSTCSTNSPTWSEASLPQTPASDTESFVSFDLNDDNDDEEDVEIVTCNAVSMKPQMYQEPQWKTAMPVSAPPIPPKAPGRCSPPAAAIDRPHPPRTSSLDDASKRNTRAGPQFGIARQVSVVRRASPGGLRVPSPAVAQSPVMLDPTAPMSVFSKQPLRPKIVDVRNRKSTLVVMDEA